MAKTKFETETCSRCQGSGRYSFCQEYGDRCFKCAGSGLVLTKRGMVARAYFEALCTKPVSSIKIGDRISVTSFTNGGRMFHYIATIVEISAGEPVIVGSTQNQVTVTKIVNYVKLLTNSDKYGKSSIGMPTDSTIRVYSSDDTDKIAQALAYQSTLTKIGTVRKTKGVSK